MHRYAKVALDGRTEVYTGTLIARPIAVPPEDIGTIENGRPAYRPIETVGDEPFDPELFERYGPDYEVEAARVVERFRIAPVPDAAGILVLRAARKAGHARMQFTGVPALGKHREYAWRVADAQKAARLAETENRLLDDSDRAKFPFLAAGLGIAYDDMLEEAHRLKAEAEDIRHKFAVIYRNSLLLERDLEALLKDGVTEKAVKAAAVLIERADMLAAS